MIWFYIMRIIFLFILNNQENNLINADFSMVEYDKNIK